MNQCKTWNNIFKKIQNSFYVFYKNIIFVITLFN